MPFRILLCSLLCCVAALAQPNGQETAQEREVDPELIAGRLQALELQLSPAERESNSAYVAWRSAQSAIEQQSAAKENQAAIERLAQEAPALLNAVRMELARSPLPLSEEYFADFTREQLAAELAGEAARVEAARAQQDELEQELEGLSKRRRELPEEMIRLRSREATLADALVGALASTGADELVQAQVQQFAAQLAALRAELALTQTALATHEIRSELLVARRERAKQSLQESEGRVNIVQASLALRRAADATAAVAETQERLQESLGQPVLLQELAGDNASYAALRLDPDGAARTLSATNEQLSELTRTLSDLRARVHATRRRVEVAGLTTAIGLYLRSQYEKLPRTARLASQARACQAEASDAQYQVLILGEDLERTESLEREWKALVQAERAARGAAAAEEIERTGAELIDTRRELLRALISDYNALFDCYVELDFVAQETEQLAQTFRRYIEERILGVRSIAGSLIPSFSALQRELAWLVNPSSWFATIRAVGRAVWDHLGEVFWRALLLSGILALQPLARRSLRESGEQVANYATDRFVHTVRALCATLLLALPPALLCFLGFYLLDSAVAAADVATAAAAGLEACAFWLLFMEFVRQVFRADGLARRHFRWPEASVTFVRRQLRWLDTVAVPAIFLVVALDREPRDLRGDTLGRIALWVGLVALASFARRVLRPSGIALAPYLAKSSGGWMDRLRFLWYPLAIGAPIAALALSLAGYHYTAFQLSLHYVATIGFVCTLVFGNALLLRWLFVAKRQLMLEAAAQRREAREAADKREDDIASEISAGDDGSFNFPAINEKTRKFFASLMLVAAFVGLWSIWDGVLPAVRALERVQVWPRLELRPLATYSANELAMEDALSGPLEPSAGISQPTVEAQAQAALSGAKTANSTVALDLRTHVITLSDLLYALLILLVTVIGARDLPALIEILLLQFFNLDAGARYAIGSIARYLVTLVGGSLVLSALNIGWSNVQCLAAALTFGLAFGLQEIFANFVSGLILLIERPVRVGDLVTVGDVEGWVTRIRFRATTILDADRRELIVPNKDFITGRLINWTLTDPITRVRIPVGVAYGADTKLVRELLQAAACECELALKDPKPRAFFQRFGESSLDFELRVFIADRQFAPDLVHDLHCRIEEKLRAHAIEIPYPQRDLHLRSSAIELLGGGRPKPGMAT